MKLSTKMILPAMLLAVGAAPAAAVTYTSLPGAPDPGKAANEALLVDFDSELPGGFELTGSYGIQSGTNSLAAAPALDRTNYLFTPASGTSGFATLTTLDLLTVSFYWGSMDDYNTVEILGANGATIFSLAGSAFLPANGDRSSAATNRRVFFTAEGDEVITGLRFISQNIAFEVDDIAGSGPGIGATVPEPTTWALMIGGFGLVGIGARRSRRSISSHVTS